MGAFFTHPTFANGGMDTTYQRPVLDDDIRYRANWNYERRGPVAKYQSNPWTHLWPRGGFMGTDQTSPELPMGQGQVSDYVNDAFFEPPILGDGNQSQKFLLGTTRDSGGTVLANAIVQGFRTTDDAFVGEVTSGEDGTFRLPTNNPASVQHYLTAYKVGSPDITGSTVNTLTPTNIDGT